MVVCEECVCWRFIVCVPKRDELAVRFFFFKEETAYDMRISDWSSDVCSSDLHGLAGHLRIAGVEDQVAFIARMIGLRAIDAQARVEAVALEQIGRASCRERVCQYV